MATAILHQAPDLAQHNAHPIADTIIEQLGGYHRLRMMIGARDFRVGFDPDSNTEVCFAIPSNLSRQRINMLCVALMPSDTYRVRFLLIRRTRNPAGYMVKTVDTADDVYHDALREVIERHTGLVLATPRIRGLQ
jgi:hypothetical protein